MWWARCSFTRSGPDHASSQQQAERWTAARAAKAASSRWMAWSRWWGTRTHTKTEPPRASPSRLRIIGVRQDHTFGMTGRKVAVSQCSTRPGLRQRTALLLTPDGSSLTISWSHCPPVCPEREVTNDLQGKWARSDDLRRRSDNLGSGARAGRGRAFEQSRPVVVGWAGKRGSEVASGGSSAA